MKPCPFAPGGLRVEELLVRDAAAADVPKGNPAFEDPAVGGETGLPPPTAGRRLVPGTVMRPSATVERPGVQREESRSVDADLCAAVAT